MGLSVLINTAVVLTLTSSIIVTSISFGFLIFKIRIILTKYLSQYWLSLSVINFLKTQLQSSEVFSNSNRLSLFYINVLVPNLNGKPKFSFITTHSELKNMPMVIHSVMYNKVTS